MYLSNICDRLLIMHQNKMEQLNHRRQQYINNDENINKRKSYLKLNCHSVLILSKEQDK